MTKKYNIAIIAVIFIFNTLQAQSIDDALRYSDYSPFISARTMGLGATMNAIGTDPASNFINPAGLGNSRRGEFQISFSNKSYNNQATYFTQYAKSLGSNLSLPNLNLVIPSIKYDLQGNPRKTDLVSNAWQFGINKLANYNEEIIFNGTNDQNSVTDYFAHYANSVNPIMPPSQLLQEPGYLDNIAYRAGAIAYQGSTGTYVSAYDGANSKFSQIGSITRKGNKMAYSIGHGINIEHLVQLGFMVGINSINFSQNVNITETDLRSTTGADADIQSINYYYTYFDKGYGFNGKIGGIVQLHKGIKLGASYEFPTRYSIKTQFGYDVGVILDDNASPTIKSLRYSTSPLNTNSYYTVTPGVLNIGINCVLDKKFMANFEIVSINYAKAKLGDTNGPYIADNAVMASTFSNSQIVKVGLEYNHAIPKNKNLTMRLRIGYMNKPSQFNRAGVNNFQPLLKSENNIMFGTGLISKMWYIDLGVRLASQNTFYMPYSTSFLANPTGVEFLRRQNTVQVTTGFKF